MTEKRFQYNVNKNTIEYDGKFVAYLNSVDGCRIANHWNALYKENEQLRHDATILIQSNQDYRRENEQLKHRLAISEKANFVTALAEENKQLKRRNKKLEKHLRKFYSDEEWKLREALGDFE